MQRILVTGATGFIGGHLAETLTRNGFETRCLVRNGSDTTRLTKLGASLVVGDVTRSHGLDQAVEGVDVVFHLAGKVVAHSHAEMLRANEQGTELIAAACARQKTQPTLVVVSSVAAAGPVERNRIRLEKDGVAPVSKYGHSKHLGELAAARWADKLPMSVVRPGVIFGPGDRVTLPIFDAIARYGVHPFVGRGKMNVSLLYVNDLIRLLLKVAQYGERLSHPENNSLLSGDGVYFAAHDVAPSYREFGEMIAGEMEKRCIPIPLFPPAAFVLAATNQLLSRIRRRPDGLNIDKIREATQPSWAVSNQKAKRQLSWSPQASLAEQIQATIAWYEQSNWLKVRRLRGRVRKPTHLPQPVVAMSRYHEPVAATSPRR